MNVRVQQMWQVTPASAQAYEEYLVPLLFAPGAKALVALTQVQTGERVLDVGCGTGIVARTAAESVGATGKVTGIDRNEAMLEVARLASASSRPVIEWKRGDAATLPVADGAHDVAICQQALQFFPDRPAALSEMHRALAPEGRLALAVLRSLHHNPGYAQFADLLERHAGPEAGAMMRSPFAEISVSTLRELVAAASFASVRLMIVSAAVRYPSADAMFHWEAASSPMADELLGMNAEATTRLVEDLRNTFADHTDDTGITFPAETYIVLATKGM